MQAKETMFNDTVIATGDLFYEDGNSIEVGILLLCLLQTQAALVRGAMPGLPAERADFVT